MDQHRDRQSRQAATLYRPIDGGVRVENDRAVPLFAARLQNFIAPRTSQVSREEPAIAHDHAKRRVPVSRGRPGLTGKSINNFLNKYTLIQMATDASGFAIMGVGATIVIIAGGIDLSVGAIYALAGVAMAMVLRALGPMDPMLTVFIGLSTCMAVSVACGLANGLMVIGLGVHPFIITLGTMWMVRGLAFVISHAESILVPQSLTAVAKASMGMGSALYPVPLLAMVATTIVGGNYLKRTVMGRHVFAVGGNPEASRFSGLHVNRIKLGVFLLSALAAGVAAFLGALLIVMIRQSIRTLHLDQNYEWIIIGAAMIMAVVLDQGGTRLIARRLAANSPTARAG